MSHPAQFSPSILEALRPIIASYGVHVHDPFAGPGIRLGRLCDEVGVGFSGTEIEAPYITDPRVRPGDSTDPETYPPSCPPSGPWIVVTSPVYPNGMTDHFDAKDGSRRHTYRQGLAEILGYDVPLHPNNMGRWGNCHRRSMRVEAEHWRIARECVRWWPTEVVLNVKDVVARDYRVDVTTEWAMILQGAGYAITMEQTVATPGQRDGANGALRADHETIIQATRLND